MQNFMKTILSAVKIWTKGEIKDSTADWNQNDETALDFVKNRTHWSETESKSIIIDMGTGYEDSSGLYVYVDADVAQDIYYNFENAIFTYGSGTSTKLSVNYDTGIEKSSLISGGYLTVNTTENYIRTGNHGGGGVYGVLSIIGDFETVHTLDEKFIPTSLARVEDMNKCTGSLQEEINFNASKVATIQKDLTTLETEVDENASNMIVYNATTTMPSSEHWTSIAYGNGKFVAITFYGKVAYSTDGITWLSSQLRSGTWDTGYYWSGIAYGNGKFVVAGFNRNNSNAGIIAYSTDAINWSYITMSSLNTINCIVYGADKFIVASESSKAAYSSNGTDWTEITVPFGYMYMAYGNEMFVASRTLGSGSRFAYSTDGIIWTENTSSIKEIQIATLLYVKDRFIAGDYYSTDGIVWVEGTNLRDPTSVAYDEEKIIVVKRHDLYYSTDSVNVIHITMPSDITSWELVAYGDGKFVAISYNSNIATYSIDGIHWGCITQDGKDITSEVKELILPPMGDTSDEVPGGGISVTGATVGQTVKISAVDNNGVPTAWEPVDFTSVGSAESEWKTKEYDFSSEDVVSVVFDLPSENIKEAVLSIEATQTGTTSNGKSYWRIYADVEATASNADKLYVINGGDLYTTNRNALIHYEVLSSDIVRAEFWDFASNAITSARIATHAAKEFLYFALTTDGATMKGNAVLKYRE